MAHITGMKTTQSNGKYSNEYYNDTYKPWPFIHLKKGNHVCIQLQLIQNSFIWGKQSNVNCYMTQSMNLLHACVYISQN